jgi:SAM-dependent methyltransferase
MGGVDDTAAAKPAFEGVFDADYLHFYAGFLTDERSDADAELIGRLLDVEPGMAVLDLACGHGRIANRLAAKGCEVTGLDAVELFLDLARRDAAALGVAVDYVHGDMRRLPWTARFDRVVSWFTAYGYFDDEDNRTVLAEVARSLRPGGRLLVELNNRDWILRNFQPHRVTQLGDDLLIDRSEPLDLLTGRMVTRRTMIRGGTVRDASYVVRQFTFTELRGWLLDAGFTTVDGYDEHGAPLTLDSRRMIVVATVPT